MVARAADGRVLPRGDSGEYHGTGQRRYRHSSAAAEVLPDRLCSINPLKRTEFTGRRGDSALQILQRVTAEFAEHRRV